MATPQAGSGRSTLTQPALEEGDLVVRFREVLRKKGAMTRIATKARVSPKTLKQLLGAEKHESNNPPNGAKWKNELEKWQKRVGVTKALTRLLHFAARDLEIDPLTPEDVENYAVAFGIPRGDPYLRSSVSSALRELTRPKETDDSASRAIRERGQANVGMLLWDPYCPASTDPDPDDCFAGRFLKTLYQSVFPWFEIKFREEPYTGIELAIDDLLSEPPMCDGVFALYITPARMGEGLEFIEIPGVRGHLGLLTKTGAMHKLTRHDAQLPPVASVWKCVLGAEEVPIEALTISREVGDSLLRGVAGYKPDKYRTVFVNSTEEWNPPSLANRFRELEANSKKTVVFVAEWGICERVKQELNGESGSEAYENLQYDENTTPWYPTGIAIRSDAHMLIRCLRFALEHEAFDLARHRTADWYYDLVARYVDHVTRGAGRHVPPVIDFRGSPAGSRRAKAISEIHSTMARRYKQDYGETPRIPFKELVIHDDDGEHTGDSSSSRTHRRR